MELKKQTVWLLTMLTVMVVLSAYYLMQGPSEQVPVASDEQEEKRQQEIVIETEENTGKSLVEENGEIDVDTGNTEGKATGESEGTDPSDFFIEYKMNRDAQQSKKLDRLQSIIASDESAEMIAEAKNELDALSERYDAQLRVEELIKGLGYEESVVVASENRVDVVVRAETLSKKEAVDVIGLVTEHIGVPGQNVKVIRR